MTKFVLLCFSSVVVLALGSFSDFNPPLIGKRMPEITGLTINNHKIDSNYFKNKVTLITFFYIGCAPCMTEIAALKKLKKHKDFQVLYIAPHTPIELRQFNSDGKNGYSVIRNKYKAGKIDYEILPECEQEGWRDSNDKSSRLECSHVSTAFGVFGYPATFIIDRGRIIRHSFYGFSMEKNDSLTVGILQKRISLLLSGS